MIINTDDSKNPGDHWLGLILNKKKCYFFDSFGIPIVEKNIVQYLYQKYPTAVVNTVCIQDTFSELCGMFVIGFVSFVKDEQDYEKFISIFDPLNLRKNDEIILKLLRK